MDGFLANRALGSNRGTGPKVPVSNECRVLILFIEINLPKLVAEKRVAGMKLLRPAKFFLILMSLSVSCPLRPAEMQDVACSPDPSSAAALVVKPAASAGSDNVLPA